MDSVYTLFDRNLHWLFLVQNGREETSNALGRHPNNIQQNSHKPKRNTKIAEHRLFSLARQRVRRLDGSPRTEGLFQRETSFFFRQLFLCHFTAHWVGVVPLVGGDRLRKQLGG